MYKKIILLSLAALANIPLPLAALGSASAISEDSSEKVCPLHQNAERDQEEETLPETPSTVQPTQSEEKDDNTESAQRILQHFAQVVAHFFSLLKDPKNPVVVQPHLNGMFSGMVSIFMEALKKNGHQQLHTHSMPEHYAYLAAKLNEKITVMAKA